MSGKFQKNNVVPQHRQHPGVANPPLRKPRKIKIPKFTHQVKKILTILKPYVKICHLRDSTIRCGDILYVKLTKTDRRTIIHSYLRREGKSIDGLTDSDYAKCWHKIRRALTDKGFWSEINRGGNTNTYGPFDDNTKVYVFTNILKCHEILMGIHLSTVDA